VNLIQISSEGRQLLSQELHHYHRVIQRHSRATSTVSVIGPPRVPTRVPAKYDQHCDRPGVQSYEYLGRTIRQ
jgi:hypothetical protein